MTVQADKERVRRVMPDVRYVPGGSLRNTNIIEALDSLNRLAALAEQAETLRAERERIQDDVSGGGQE